MRRKSFNVAVYLLSIVFLLFFESGDLRSESAFEKWFKEHSVIKIDTAGLSVSGLREILVGPGGEIIFLTPKESCLFEFDSEGKFIKKIGRQGQGPGEFMTPIAFCFDKDGNLYIADSKTHRISILRPDNTLVSSFIYLCSPSRVSFDHASGFTAEYHFGSFGVAPQGTQPG